VSTVIIGARDEGQLRDNLGAVGWSLAPDQVARLDPASAFPPRTRIGTSGGSPRGTHPRSPDPTGTAMIHPRPASVGRPYGNRTGSGGVSPTAFTQASVGPVDQTCR
jgi:hypothetical protein